MWQKNKRCPAFGTSYQLFKGHVLVLNCAGRSCLHMLESWRTDSQLASQRLHAIDFLVHSCGADVNIQVVFISLPYYICHIVQHSAILCVCIFHKEV